MSDDYLSKPLSFGAPSPARPSQQVQSLSPYLNYDTRYMQSQPEFIFPEGASKQRGRFELAFSQIGSSAMIGAGIGGAAGFYNGVRATALANHTGKLRRTQLLNHVMKQGAATANTLGTLAVMYSVFGVVLQWARGEDDEINTIAAGGATGLLYKSTAGLRKCAIGGGVGLALSSLYVLWNVTGGSSKKLKELRSQYM
ncbi:mitochondrial import inner membrane translocase subunit Tim23 [Ochlerotatus camptorhynchus]|uniref:mitochondrial import inner membrane translocase subunit Tim23 n=1 Tax=Ochlerotatus camptorhynchus TaxID=644619 RepID=UPI0031CF6D4B